MTLAFLYWFFVLCYLLFWVAIEWRVQPPPRWPAALNLIVLFLFILIGIKLFGRPIKG